MTGTLDVRVLGPVDAILDGTPLPLGGSKPRSILALLALEPRRVVPVARIVEALWGDEEVSDRVLNTLQVHISNLRRALQPATDAYGGASLVARQASGYVLNVDVACTDLGRFDLLLREARQLAASGEPARAAGAARAAMAEWTGDPLAGLEDQEFHERLAVRLRERRRDATLVLLEAEVAAGRHAAVLSELAAAVDADPLDEHASALLIMALYRSGRQADALAAYGRLRVELRERLGLEPSPQLQDLERQVLVQDPTLSVEAGSAGAGGVALEESSTVLRSSVVIPDVIVVVAGVERRVSSAKLTIGRRFDQGLVLDDVRASRQHAELRLTADGPVVVDRGSMNGTLVNGAPVTSATVADGDTITIGDTDITVRYG